MPESIPTDKIVRLINDYHACNEINEELRQRLSIAEKLNDRYIKEVALCQQINERYSQVVVQIGKLKNENEQLNDKLRRTRRIGLAGAVVSFVGGVVFVLII